MENLTPRHISEAESDSRGVKDGWYAVSKTGNLGRCVFPNRFECVEHIEHLTNIIDTYDHWTVGVSAIECQTEIFSAAA